MITSLLRDAGALHLQVASLSDRGDRSGNEDRLGVVHVDGRGLCCVLADGAGGQGHGALAARLTVNTVLEGFAANPLFAPAGLASLISMAEQTVCGEQRHSVSRQHMSATVVVLTIDTRSGRALWAHWGDSRLYWFREGRVHRMTEDHSVVQQLLQAGIYRNEDPRRLPNRHVLAGAVGAESQVPPTVLGDAAELHRGDVLMLCSDGLWENLLEPEMEAALAQADGPEDWLESMLAMLQSKAKAHQDNCSALTVWVLDKDTAQ
jgi:serine/threonine protein phosphatase PrpC